MGADEAVGTGAADKKRTGEEPEVAGAGGGSEDVKGVKGGVAG